MAKGIVTGGLNGKGGNYIKSIQRGIEALPNAGGTLTRTISAVDMSKSIVICSSVNSVAGVVDSEVLVGCEFISGTSIKFTRNKAGNPMNVYWTVIEFNDVKSLQRGTTAGSATISSVNTQKCLLFYSWTTSDNLVQANTGGEVLYVSNSTTLQGNRYGNVTFYWQIIEFN